MSNQIMCHVVAGYPTTQTCLKIMRGMQKSGVKAIEVQMPFSDPIADGEVIMRANDVALAGGMTTENSFELIEKAREQDVDCDIYVMSYIQKARHFGLEKFCQRAADCQVRGLIIPDLPYDSPEFPMLKRLTEKFKLELVPVLSPGMPTSRLRSILAFNPLEVYVTSQRGITGNSYSATNQLKQLASNIKSACDAKIMIGFGIASPGDVRNALKIGDMAVVGSAVIKQLQATTPEKTMEFVRSLIVPNVGSKKQ